MKLTNYVLFWLVSLTAYGQTNRSDSVTANPAIAPVQRQLAAYNARNIDAFLEPYADDVEVYDFPDKLRYRGKDEMRKRYGGMFERTKDLHCQLVNRISVGSTVIDHESVTSDPAKKPVQAVAIYRVENGKIKQVYFTR